MNCPKCRTRLKCQDTRQRPGNVRYRLYECPKCDYRVTSTERIDFEKSKRIKNNSWHDLLKGINWNMLKWNDKYYDYNFELPIIREDGAFSTRSINSNTQKAHDQCLVMGFFISFLSSPLMRGFLVLLSSVARINRQNVINRIPFNVSSVFKVKNLDKYLRSFEKVARLSYPQNSWCGFHAPGNCVPDKKLKEIKLMDYLG